MELFWIDYKVVAGTIWTILALVAYLPYIKDTMKGETKPHVYSWFIRIILWTITTILQWQDGAWPWARVTWWVTFTCIVVVVLALRQWWERDITMWDSIALVLSLISIVVRLLLDHPLFAMIVVTIAEALSFYPTLRKAYRKPFEETISWYAMAAVRSVFAIIALSQITWITVMYPAFLILVCWWTALFILIRRRQMDSMVSVSKTI